jgi:hypothetical protein
MSLCLISDIDYCWLKLVKWATNNLKGSSFRVTICKLAWWAAVYHIWQQRNAIIHSRKIRTREQIVKDVRKDVKCRLESFSKARDSILNRILCCKWGVNSNVLCKRHD